MKKGAADSSKVPGLHHWQVESDLTKVGRLWRSRLGREDQALIGDI